MRKSHGPPPGFSRADLHVHTTYSDGTMTPEGVLNFYALHSDVRVFAITDHDTMDGAIQAQQFARAHPDLFGHLDVIVGEEVSSTDGHVIGLFMQEWVPPGMSAADTVKAIHDQGALAIAAHPYTNLMKFTGLIGVGDLIKELPFDAVETRNANFTEFYSNWKAERNAGNKARVGASDGHFLDAIGRCYTEFPGSTGPDLREAILKKATVAGGRCYGAFTLAKFVITRLRRGEWVFPQRNRVRRESASGGLEILIHEDSSLSAAVLTPVGRLDAVTMPEMKETVTLLTGAKVSVVLDLSRVEFLGSAGITALVAGLKTARQTGAGFCLAAMSNPVEMSLAGAGLLSAFPRANDVEQARERIAVPVDELIPEHV